MVAVCRKTKRNTQKGHLPDINIPDLPDGRWGYNRARVYNRVGVYNRAGRGRGEDGEQGLGEPVNNHQQCRKQPSQGTHSLLGRWFSAGKNHIWVDSI